MRANRDRAVPLRAGLGTGQSHKKSPVGRAARVSAYTEIRFVGQSPSESGAGKGPLVLL